MRKIFCVRILNTLGGSCRGQAKELNAMRIRCLDTIKARLGIGLGAHSKRKWLSFRYIKRGCGLEIGALHLPLPVAEGVVVKYVDRVERDGSIAKFPELDSSKIVKPDYIEDGFVLSSFPDSSQDFLIANHVLEHASNPIQVLLNWSRVLKPKGFLFVTVPIAEQCFDRGRAITTLQHFIDDFNLCNRREMDRFHERNRAHYVEWVNVSLPNILREQGVDYTRPSAAEIQRQIDEMLANLEEIHFHTFTAASFKELMSFLTSGIDRTMKVQRISVTEEVAAMLRKK